MTYFESADVSRRTLKKTLTLEEVPLSKSLLDEGNPQSTLKKMDFSHEVPQDLSEVLQEKPQRKAMSCVTNDVALNDDFLQLENASTRRLFAHLMHERCERIGGVLEDTWLEGKPIYANLH